MKIINQHFEDVDEFKQFLDLSSLEFKQVSKGHFNRSINHRKLSNCNVMRAESTSHTLHQGIYSNQFLHVHIPVYEGGSFGMHNGEVISPENILMVSPSEESMGFVNYQKKFVVDFNFEALSVYLQPEVMELLSKRTDLVRSNKIGLNQIDKVKRSIVSQSNLLLNTENLSPLALDAGQECLFLTLEYLFRGVNLAASENPKVSTRYNVVRRVLDYLNSTQNANVSVKQLLLVAHCSLRTLEYAFMHLLGVTPKTFLNLRKMHLIRVMLKEGNATSVTQLLDDYGIINKGRFRLRYYQLFGEYPRDTFRRKKKLIV